jgi:hypothetical protein
MRNTADPLIPFSLSDLAPSELKSSTDPAIRAMQRKDAEIWARNGYARRDVCSRCPRYYDEESHNCLNAKLHGDQSKRLEVYREGLRAYLEQSENEVQPEEVLV